MLGETTLRSPLALSLLFLSSSYAADSKYTLTYESPVEPGDLLTLTGKERFNRGQMRNIAFHIGPMVVAAQFVSPDAVRLVVPDFDDGTYPVSVIKHDTNPGKDIVLFSQEVEIVSAREHVLAATSGTINSGNGEVVLPGVAAIEAVEDTSRPTSTFTIEHVESRGDAALFKALLLAGENNAGKNLPPLVAPTLVRLSTTSGFTGFITVRIKVDPAFLASIPAGLGPEIYAVTVVNGSVVPSSKREVSQFTFTNGKFAYDAPVDLGALKLAPGKSVPLEMRVVAKSSGKTATVYKGR